MKDHEIAKLVNDLAKEIRKICPNAPMQLRAVISEVVVKHNKKHHTY